MVVIESSLVSDPGWEQGNLQALDFTSNYFFSPLPQVIYTLISFLMLEAVQIGQLEARQLEETEQRNVPGMEWTNRTRNLN